MASSWARLITLATATVAVRAWLASRLKRAAAEAAARRYSLPLPRPELAARVHSVNAMVQRPFPLHYHTPLPLPHTDERSGSIAKFSTPSFFDFLETSTFSFGEIGVLHHRLPAKSRPRLVAQITGARHWVRLSSVQVSGKLLILGLSCDTLPRVTPSHLLQGSSRGSTTELMSPSVALPSNLRRNTWTPTLPFPS